MDERAPILVCARDVAWGGGVAEVARLVTAHIPGARLHRIGRRPDGPPLAPVADPAHLYRRIRRTGTRSVLLNSSLRSRSLTRDLMLARAASAAGARVGLWIHGADERWLTGLRRAGIRSVLRALLRPVACIGVLTPEQHAAMTGLGPSVVSLTAAWDPLLRQAGLASPAQSHRWLFLGRLTRAKGVWSLVRAAASVPHLAVDLAGNGPERAALARWTTHHGVADRIRLVGFLDASAKARALRSAAGLVLPSWSEGCPVSVLEAMGLGLPVVATDVGALPDLSPGPLVPPRDDRALAQALAALDGDPSRRAALGDANARKADAMTAAAVASSLLREGLVHG